MAKILHQLDRHNDEIVGDWWVLAGVNYHQGLPLKSKGFKWLKGPDGGSWLAPGKDALSSLIDAGMPVINTGNGHNRQEN